MDEISGEWFGEFRNKAHAVSLAQVLIDENPCADEGITVRRASPRAPQQATPPGGGVTNRLRSRKMSSGEQDI